MMHLIITPYIGLFIIKSKLFGEKDYLVKLLGLYKRLINFIFNYITVKNVTKLIFFILLSCTIMFNFNKMESSKDLFIYIFVCPIDSTSIALYVNYKICLLIEIIKKDIGGFIFKIVILYIIIISIKLLLIGVFNYIDILIPAVGFKFISEDILTLTFGKIIYPMFSNEINLICVNTLDILYKHEYILKNIAFNLLDISSKTWHYDTYLHFNKNSIYIDIYTVKDIINNIYLPITYISSYKNIKINILDSNFKSVIDDNTYLHYFYSFAKNIRSSIYNLFINNKDNIHMKCYPRINCFVNSPCKYQINDTGLYTWCENQGIWPTNKYSYMLAHKCYTNNIDIRLLHNKIKFYYTLVKSDVIEDKSIFINDAHRHTYLDWNYVKNNRLNRCFKINYSLGNLPETYNYINVSKPDINNSSKVSMKIYVLKHSSKTVFPHKVSNIGTINEYSDKNIPLVETTSFFEQFTYTKSPRRVVNLVAVKVTNWPFTSSTPYVIIDLNDFSGQYLNIMCTQNDLPYLIQGFLLYADYTTCNRLRQELFDVKIYGNICTYHGVMRENLEKHNNRWGIWLIINNTPVFDYISQYCDVFAGNIHAEFRRPWPTDPSPYLRDRRQIFVPLHEDVFAEATFKNYIIRLHDIIARILSQWL